MILDGHPHRPTHLHTTVRKHPHVHAGALGALGLDDPREEEKP